MGNQKELSVCSFKIFRLDIVSRKIETGRRIRRKCKNYAINWEKKDGKIQKRVKSIRII